MRLPRSPGRTRRPCQGQVQRHPLRRDLVVTTLTIEPSQLRDNPNAGFPTAAYPGIFFLGQGHPVVLSSSLS